MALTVKSKNEPVEVVVLRAFRYRKPDGTMTVLKPGKGKPNVVSLPYQFAREMEAAKKVSFDVKNAVEIKEK